MTISQKLSFIILFTILEVSITIWAAFQISKGADFHQLNSLHLKFGIQFSREITSIKSGKEVSVEKLVETIEHIREQPIACLEQVNFIDEIVMKNINTFYALDICRKDIKDADTVLTVISEYAEKKTSKKKLIESLDDAFNEFDKNSASFEAPITKTVDFILQTMIPIVVFISLFNICLISYLSRSITGSIRSIIKLLSNGESSLEFINNNISGELKELLSVSRERLKEDLVKSEEIQDLKGLQGLIMNNNPDLLFVKDKNYKIVTANKAFMNVYPEEQREEVIGFTTFESYSEEEANIFLTKDKEAFDIGYSDDYQEITFPDGETRILYTQKIRFEDAQKETFILGVGKNVTKQLQEEGLLGELYKIAASNDVSVDEKIHRALVLGSTYLNLSTGIVSKIKNDSCEVLSIFSKTELMQPEQLHHIEKVFCEHTFKENKVTSYQDISKSKILENSSLIKAAVNSYIGTTVYVNGTAYGVICFTGKKVRKCAFTTKEESVLKLLAQWVGTELTRKYAEKKLYAVNTKLKQSNDELEQFAYRTSHDLKAPLATIKGLTNFMEEDLQQGDVEEVAKNLTLVYKHANRLEHLVVDILNLAKADLQDSPFMNVNIFDLIESIKEDLQDVIQHKNVIIKSNICTDFMMVSQKTRIQQILSNIIANAVKYSDPDKKEKFVYVESIVNDQVCLSVIDNGVGIDKLHLETLFNMFSRFNPELSDGSGLGMSIVKKNVEALGGTIFAVSNDKGTRFDIKLPIIKMKDK